MSGTHNKNLLFYSLYPNDKISRQCLAELEKLPELKKQFVKFCVHDPRNINGPAPIKLPKIVYDCMERGLVPIIAAAGFNQPIHADSALSWIKQSALNKSGIMPSNIHGQGGADNCSTIEQASRSGNSLFDTDYNIGFSSGQGEFNKGYASIDEAVENRIVTYDEANDKNQASQEIQQRLEQLKFNRDTEVPRQQQRIGGVGNGGQMPQMPMQQGGMQQMPMQQQQQGMPQMPMQQGGMPQMPMQQQGGMPQMPMQQRGMPQMPMQQQGHRHKRHSKRR